MKNFLFVPIFLLSFSLSAQVSFQYETRKFTQLNLTTDGQIAEYLQIELSDLIPIYHHNSIRGQFIEISPSDFYNLVTTTFRSRDMGALLRISKDLGVSFDRLLIAFSKEMDFLPEADIQMILALYRIGLKWEIISF